MNTHAFKRGGQAQVEGNLRNLNSEYIIFLMGEIQCVIS